jgi:PTS system cellobiose-specific IIC component
MDVLSEKLGAVGAWCGQNKYLNGIKNAFQNYMPATISGAVGVLWSNVLVSDTSGLGLFFKPIMVLQPLNTIFNALNTATIGMMTIGVTMLLAQEIADANGENSGAYPAVLGFMMWMMVTPTSIAVEGADAVSGIATSYCGAAGLFTGLVVGILGTELYCKLRKMDALKIKMPESVPAGVARAFEVLIPTCITLVIVGAVGFICETATGMYLNDLISHYVQEPLKNIIGANIFAVMVLYVIIMLFWCIGMHGNNMVAAVKESIFTPMVVENMEVYSKTGKASDAPNVLNITMMQMFAEWGGSGVTLGLVICILVFSKREDNRTIASISLVPGIFNINETMTFGIPLVLNPILDVPFILAPVITVLVGYILTVIGFCPKVVLQAPWTCPPIIFGFIATGANVMGSVSQIIVMALATVIYLPFFLAYEAQQNKESAEA